MKKIAFMIPVHDRHQQLKVIVRQLALIPHCWRHFFFFLDRPTNEVRRVVREILEQYFAISAFQIHIMSMPFALMDEKLHFRAARSWQMRRVEEILIPDYGSIWDDDMVLQDPAEVAPLLDKADLISAWWHYVWDQPEMYDKRFEHHAVVFWRWREKDQFHAESGLNVKAPEGVHDDPNSRKVELKQRILDYGFFTEEYRQNVIKRYAKAGRRDDFALMVGTPPLLEELPQESKERSIAFAGEWS